MEFESIRPVTAFDMTLCAHGTAIGITLMDHVYSGNLVISGRCRVCESQFQSNIDSIACFSARILDRRRSQRI